MEIKYVIAQFYPRMAVYNDVEVGKICSFGSGEFVLPFVTNTVPADHVMEATGDLMNRSEVLLLHRLKRWELAENLLINQ
jgi:hypothetical protein